MKAVSTKWLSVVSACFVLIGCNGGPIIPPPPTNVSITQNPANISVNAGQTATFTAAATGSPVPTVQWQSSSDGGATFQNIAGAATATLTVPGVSAGQNGTQFRAVFTNSSNTATTTAGTLTVLYAPTVTVNPVNMSVAAGTAVTLTATATGNGAPTVQWQQSSDGGATFTNIAGATSTALSFTALASQNGNQYRAVFTNTVGSATTTAATLTVPSNVVITQNPADVSLNAGQTATFTAAATGGPSPSVQWQLSTDGGATFNNIAGATTVSHSFIASAGQNGNKFRAVFTNSSSSATTTAATLTVFSAPTVTLNPANISVAAGATATFTSTATGNLAPTVQWQVSSDGGATFTNVAGATSTTLSFTAAGGQNGNKYRAVFVNAVGTATSIAATLTVNGKQWGTAVQLENGAGVGVFPLEAVDANGNVVAIWTKTSGSYATVWSSRFVASSGTWSAAQLISSATDSAEAGQLALATDTAGNALAVWAQTAGAINATGVSGIWSSRFDVGTQSWSAPQLIGGDATPGSVVGIAKRPSYPQVAIDPNGNAFAIWEQNNGLSSATQNVWAARYAAGGGWNAAIPITTDNNVSSGNQQIGFDSAGNAIVVYTINTVVNLAGDILIKSTRYNKVSATWSAAQLIAADTTFSVIEPRLAVSANGDAVAVWQQNDGAHDNVVSNHYDAAMALWSTAQIIDTNVAGETEQPAVAIDVNGNAWAIWTRAGTTQGTHIWTNRFTAGGTWGTPQIIDTINAQSARYAEVAFDSSGKAMAVWSQTMPLVTNGPNYSIIVASYNSGTSWSSTQVLETQPADSYFSQVLFDASGNATAVWQKTDTAGINTTIWGNRFQ